MDSAAPAEEAVADAVVALGLGEDLLVAAARLGAASNAGHSGRSPSVRRRRGGSALRILR